MPSYSNNEAAQFVPSLLSLKHLANLALLGLLLADAQFLHLLLYVDLACSKLLMMSCQLHSVRAGPPGVLSSNRHRLKQQVAEQLIHFWLTC